jgi:hypothetical protein
LSSPFFRMFCCAVYPYQIYNSRCSVPLPGRIAIVTDAGRDAVDASASGMKRKSQGGPKEARERSTTCCRTALSRTTKSCGPVVQHIFRFAKDDKNPLKSSTYAPRAEKEKTPARKRQAPIGPVHAGSRWGWAKHGGRPDAHHEPRQAALHRCQLYCRIADSSQTLRDVWHVNGRWPRWPTTRQLLMARYQC